MTGYPSDSVTSQSNPARRTSLLSAQKLVLMASVVTGLGVGVAGFRVASDLDIFTSPAQAQVNYVFGVSMMMVPDASRVA
jgi:serine protease Do